MTLQQDKDKLIKELQDKLTLKDKKIEELDNELMEKIDENIELAQKSKKAFIEKNKKIEELLKIAELENNNNTPPFEDKISKLVNHLHKLKNDNRKMIKIDEILSMIVYQ